MSAIKKDRRRPARLNAILSVVGFLVVGAICRLWQPETSILELRKPVVFMLRGTGYQIGERFDGPGKVYLGWEDSAGSGGGFVRLVARHEPKKEIENASISPRRLELLDNSIHFTPKRLGEKVKHSMEHSFHVTRERGVLVVLIK